MESVKTVWLRPPAQFQCLFSGVLETSVFRLEFADVDGDGDYDCVTGRIWGGTSADSSDLVYFENIGTVYFPYIYATLWSANPFDTIDDVQRHD